MRRHSPVQQLSEAKQIARDHHMFVVEKAGRFLLYRESKPRNVYLGFRSSVETLRPFVERCAYQH